MKLVLFLCLTFILYVRLHPNSITFYKYFFIYHILYDCFTVLDDGAANHENKRTQTTMCGVHDISKNSNTKNTSCNAF